MTKLVIKCAQRESVLRLTRDNDDHIILIPLASITSIVESTNHDGARVYLQLDEDFVDVKETVSEIHSAMVRRYTD